MMALDYSPDLCNVICHANHTVKPPGGHVFNQLTWREGILTHVQQTSFGKDVAKKQEKLLLIQYSNFQRFSICLLKTCYLRN